MNKRIISLSLGLLLLGNQMSLLAMEPKLETEQPNETVQKNDEKILVSSKNLDYLISRLKIQEAQLEMVDGFIRYSRQRSDLELYQLKLLSKEDASTYIKNCLDKGSMKPEDAQAYEYQLGLIPFSDLELSTLSHGQLEDVFVFARNNEEIDNAKLASALLEEQKNIYKAEKLAREWPNYSTGDKVDY